MAAAARAQGGLEVFVNISAYEQTYMTFEKMTAASYDVAEVRVKFVVDPAPHISKDTAPAGNPHVAAHLKTLTRMVADGRYDVVSDELATLLGRRPKNVRWPITTRQLMSIPWAMKVAVSRTSAPSRHVPPRRARSPSASRRKAPAPSGHPPPRGRGERRVRRPGADRRARPADGPRPLAPAAFVGR
ncbi:hypothetical protein [Streptomyces mirabilis]|uniref:hypothetical protein n=1 Tax=Streptomyces mirabilis TaxID=68239 RepID=UPI0033D76657